MRILGIETSCDETAAAVVEDGYKLLSNVVASSVDLHIAYGGVVPEIAARSHIESIIPVIEKALDDAFGNRKQVTGNKLVSSSKLPVAQSDPWDQIDAIAVTYGPGLLGSLLIGVLTARTLAIAKSKPLYAVNHVEAHVYANFITEISSQQSAVNSRQSDRPELTTNDYRLMTSAPVFPMLALIVSGGHSQLVLFKNHFDYKVLGQTSDDAVGEAFDKVAKMLGLPYPGGPSVAAAAKNGDPSSVKLPKAKLDSPYNFSFSGLKTAVLRAAQELAGKDYTLPSSELPQLLTKVQKNNLAASFQHTAIETLVTATRRAVEQYNPASVVVAGGVAANQELRRQLTAALPLKTYYTDIKLCTDNAAMIAVLGYYMASHKRPQADPYSLEADPGLQM